MFYFQLFVVVLLFLIINQANSINLGIPTTIGNDVTERPRLAFSGAHLAQLKQRITEANTDAYEVWEWLRPQCASKFYPPTVGSAYTGTPPTNDVRGEIYTPMMNDLRYAQNCALCYLLRPDNSSTFTRYAQRAKEYVLKWVQWNPPSSASGYVYYDTILLDLPYIRLLWIVDFLLSDPIPGSELSQSEQDMIRDFLLNQFEPWHRQLSNKDCADVNVKTNPFGRVGGRKVYNIKMYLFFLRSFHSFQTWDNALLVNLGLMYNRADLLTYALFDSDNKCPGSSGIEKNLLSGIARNYIENNSTTMDFADFYRCTPYDPHRDCTNTAKCNKCLLPENLGYPVYNFQAVSVAFHALKVTGYDFFWFEHSQGHSLYKYSRYIGEHFDRNSAIGSQYNGWDTQKLTDQHAIKKFTFALHSFQTPELDFIRERFSDDPILDEAHMWNTNCALYSPVQSQTLTMPGALTIHVNDAPTPLYVGLSGWPDGIILGDASALNAGRRTVEWRYLPPSTYTLFYTDGVNFKQIPGLTVNSDDWMTIEFSWTDSSVTAPPTLPPSPTTAPPTKQPTTVAPTSAAPTTAPPTTAAPTTATATTAAPTTTEATTGAPTPPPGSPTTAPTPTTETTTDAPTSLSTTSSQSPASSSESSASTRSTVSDANIDDEETPVDDSLWPLIVAGIVISILVCVAVVVLFFMCRGRAGALDSDNRRLSMSSSLPTRRRSSMHHSRHHSRLQRSSSRYSAVLGRPVPLPPPIAMH